MKLKVIIHEAEEGGYWAEVPSIEGCATQGETKQEVTANIKEAIEGYVLSLEEDGLPVLDEHFETLVVAV